MRIAILGAGGQGGYYGGMLARAREDVTFIARGKQLKAIKANGLTVKPVSSAEFNIPVNATDDPAEIGTVDFLMFCVKTYDTEAAAKSILPIVGSDTMITSVQNGVDSVDRIERLVGRGHFFAGASYLHSVLEKPGVIDVRNEGVTIFGERQGEVGPRLKQWVKTLQNAGAKVELRSNILTHIWEKCVAFCAFASVEVLTRLPSGPVLACPETKEMSVRALREGMAVAEATGVTLSEGFFDEILDFVTNKVPPTHRPSLYYDLINGKRLELEALNGTIVRVGREHGIDTPMNFAIYAALKPYISGAPELPS